MADLTQAEATRLRTSPEGDASEPTGPSEHAAPLGGLGAARLTFRSGAQDLRLRAGRAPADLYRARFDGATPQVRVRDGRVIVQYRGIPFDWRKRAATIGLNTTIPWTIDVVGGVNRLEADLRDVDVRRFELDRWLRSDPARARPAARRGAGQDRRRRQGDPDRAPGRDAGPAQAPGRHRERRPRRPRARQEGRRRHHGIAWLGRRERSLRDRGRRRLEVDRHRRRPA